jgi:Tfp pilus assembly protein PilN
MRPVNLIPSGERRGEKAPLRTGVMPYVIVGLLLLALGGVTLVVITGNKVADRKAEVASLQSQVNAEQAQAAQLSDYSNFAELQQARQETVTSLATSRFDWERTLRELAIVLPGDVWLTSMNASASADSSSGAAAAGSSLASDGVTGPSLDIKGCASGQAAVAKFLAALRDIDGVTRVTVMSSDRPGANSSSSSSSSSASSGGTNTVECAAHDFIATFEVVAAFDGAQPAATTLPLSTSGTTTTTAAATQGTSETQPAAASSGGSSSNNGASPSAVVSGTGGTP